MRAASPIDLAVLEGDTIEARRRVIRAARGVVRYEGARHAVMSLKHALSRFDQALHVEHEARKVR